VQLGESRSPESSRRWQAGSTGSRGQLDQLRLGEPIEHDLRDLPEHEALPGIAPAD